MSRPAVHYLSYVIATEATELRRRVVVSVVDLNVIVTAILETEHELVLSNTQFELSNAYLFVFKLKGKELDPNALVIARLDHPVAVLFLLVIGISVSCVRIEMFGRRLGH